MPTTETTSPAPSIDQLAPAGDIAAYFVQEAGLAETELSRGLGGVDVRTIRRWMSDTPNEPQVRHAERLDDLRDIAVVLVEDGSLTPRQVGRWLRARNRALNGRRPLEVLEHDSEPHQVVREAAVAFTYGDPV